MNGFYTLRFNKIRRRLFVIIIVVIALFIFISKNMFNFITKDNQSVALLRGSDEDNNIALTFNVSWGENKISEIIDVLKKNDVQATFFVSGEWAERHLDYIEEITENGHELGMLGYRYQNYIDQDTEKVRKDLLYARDVFRKLGFENMQLLRTPSHLFNKEIIDLANKFNFEVIHWSVDTEDWKRPGTDFIVQKALDETTNGDIILMHASDSAEQTAGALKEIIPALKDKDFNFVSITALKNEINPKTELIE